jgi:hypothetical protein
MYEWRAAFGSATLVMVNHFFETSEAFKSTEECEEFAQLLLENDKFLFSNTKSDNLKVVSDRLAYYAYVLTELRNIGGHLAPRSCCKPLRLTLPPSAAASRSPSCIPIKMQSLRWPLRCLLPR